MFLKFKLFWLLAVVFFVVPSFADVSFDLDQIKRCDPVFCPSDSTNIRADVDAAREHAARSGIILESYKGGSGISGGVVTIQFNGDRVASREGAGASAEQVYDFENSSVSAVGDSAGSGSDTPGADDPNSEDQPGAFNPSQNQQQAQGGNQEGSGLTGLGAGGNSGGQTMVKGGLLYSNDDSGSVGDANFDSGNNADSVKAQSLASGQSAVMLNRQNSAVSPSGEKDSSGDGNSSRALASVGPGSGAGGGFSASGTFGSGAAGAGGGNTSSGDGFLGRLAGIAKGLGERFFGMSGSGGSQSARARASAALAEKNRLKKLAALSKNDPNFRDMLQKHMRRQRGLASSLEFGTKDSFLFGRVCQQYSIYANENGIPDDRVRCPNR